MAGQIGNGTDFRIILCACRQFLHRPRECLTHFLHPHHVICNGARPARIMNVLLPARHLHHVVGNTALGGPEIDLKCQRVTWLAGQHAGEGRVGDYAAIPVVLAVDFDGGESRRQSPGSHEMLRSQPAFGGVEIGQVAGADVDRADANAHFARVQPVEVDESLQRLLQRCRVVEACRGVAREGRPERRREAWLEEAGLAVNQGPRRRYRVANRTNVERKGQGIGQPFAGGPLDRKGADRLPELAQPLHAFAFRRAGDDGGVEGADRNSGQPVRPDARLVQAFIDAGLIGPQRSAALQHQGDDVVWQRFFQLRHRIDLLAYHVQHFPNSRFSG